MKWEKFCVVSNPWGPVFTENGARITVRETIPDDNGNPVSVVPGVYAACVRVTKTIKLPDGTTRSIKHLSNECPFMISPRIDNAVNNIFQLPAIADKTIVVTGYIFPPAEGSEPLYPSLSIYVGDMKLTGIKSAQILKAGEFKVTGADINLLIPDGLDPALHYFPLRIFVNGAESAPSWIKV